jgi:hypothetical protein
LIDVLYSASYISLLKSITVFAQASDSNKTEEVRTLSPRGTSGGSSAGNAGFPGLFERK